MVRLGPSSQQDLQNFGMSISRWRHESCSAILWKKKHMLLDPEWYYKYTNWLLNETLECSSNSDKIESSTQIHNVHSGYL